MPFPLLGKAISAGKEKIEATSELSEGWLVFLQKPAILPSSCLLFPRKNRSIFHLNIDFTTSRLSLRLTLRICHTQQSCACTTRTPLCLPLGDAALVHPGALHGVTKLAPHPRVALPLSPRGGCRTTHSSLGKCRGGPWAPPLSSATQVGSSRLCSGSAVLPTRSGVLSRVLG